mgnify:CR=1 FL=1
MQVFGEDAVAHQVGDEGEDAGGDAEGAAGHERARRRAPGEIADRSREVAEADRVGLPGTDEGDYQIKLRNLIRFFEEGDKAKVTLRFRGREMAHQEIGARMLERLKADLEPYGQVEQFPKMEGRQMIMILSPKKKK